MVFDSAGRVLLVRQSYGRRGWDIPGGGREPKESLDQALHREVREEIGAEIANRQLTGIYYEPGVDQHHFAYRCELVPGTEPKANSPEILEVGYFASTALPRPINDFTIQQIEHARAAEPVTIAVLGARQWLE